MMLLVFFTKTGLYYDSFQNDIGAERVFLEATRANAAAIPRKTSQVTVPVAEVTAEETKEPGEQKSRNF